MAKETFGEGVSEYAYPMPIDHPIENEYLRDEDAELMSIPPNSREPNETDMWLYGLCGAGIAALVIGTLWWLGKLEPLIDKFISLF